MRAVGERSVYDGVRNVQAIGADQYRYDAAGRLDWAHVESSLYGAQDIDYSFDLYGNMTDRTASPGGTLPDGLEFQGRAYAGNRISDSGFQYDANGNLLREPSYGAASQAHSFRFSPENRLMLVRPATGGSLLQEAQYDSGGNRWLRIVKGEGGKPLITLRDSSGQVAADYLISAAGGDPTLEKEYVHGAGRLLAIESYCGPRPALEIDSPPKQGTKVWFNRTDYVTPPSGAEYTIVIETESGQRRTLTEFDLPEHFGIEETEFFPDETNWVRVQGEADCGRTGYSNAASYVYSTSSCVTSTSASRSGFGSEGVSNLNLGGNLTGCPTGTTYNLYYQALNGQTSFKLNGSVPLSQLVFQINSLPSGAGHGHYWFVPVDPVTHLEGTAGPQVLDDEKNVGADLQGLPGEASANAQYVHWDHLGSTRLMTDEEGAVMGRWKYYPFGHEAEIAGGTGQRMKFTGHERDDGIGLDYMLARYYGGNLGRFTSPDPVSPLLLQHRLPEEFDALLGEPIVWNKYVYSLNNPLAYVDRTGRSATAVLTWEALGPAGAAALGEPTPFGEMAWLGLAGAVASYQLGQAIGNVIEARDNKQLFKQAMGWLSSASADLMDPGHSGMDPEDPNWKNVARRFWNKIKDALANADKIRNSALRKQIIDRVNELTNEFMRRFYGGSLNPHGECGDNICSQKDKQKPKPGSPIDPARGLPN